MMIWIQVFTLHPLFWILDHRINEINPDQLSFTPLLKSGFTSILHSKVERGEWDRGKVSDG